MEKNKKKRNQLLAERVIKGLRSRNMEGYFAQTKEEALKKALSLIPKGSGIGFGGSLSIKEIGLKDAVCRGDYKAHDRDICRSAKEKRQAELAVYDCDFMLTGSNAITQDGVLVNIDGAANRVSAMAWGPRNVLVIIGMNKVVKSVEDAVARARNEAAPVNAQRFDINTPCRETGACFNCKASDCICCQLLITRFSKTPNRIKVILVNENLGF